MVSKRKLALAVGFLCATMGSAYAEVSSSVRQQQMDALAKQIDQLRSKINDQKKNSEAAGKKLGSFSYAFQKSSAVLVDNDRDNLFETMPSTTFALALLKSRSSYKDHSLIFGGYFESDAQYWQGRAYATSNSITMRERGSQISVSTLNLDAMYNYNEWVQSFVSLQSLSVDTSPTISVHKAFLTLGNLEKSAFYLSAGKDYIPFGAFNGGGPWTPVLSRTYFRSNAAANVIFGYYASGLSAALSVFNSGLKSQWAGMSADLRYNYTITPDWSYELGMSFMNDARAADSGYGRSYTTAAQKSHGINPVWDVNGVLRYQIFSLVGELNQTAKDTYDTSNAAIGRSTVWHIAGSAAPTLFGKPTTFGVAYNRAQHISGIPTGMPNDINEAPLSSAGVKQLWIASASRAVFFQNMVLGLEYSRATTEDNLSVNAITLDSSVYF